MKPVFVCLRQQIYGFKIKGKISNLITALELYFVCKNMHFIMEMTAESQLGSKYAHCNMCQSKVFSQKIVK